MRAIEFISNVKNQSIHIPKKFQAGLKNMVGKNFRVMIFLKEDIDSNDYKSTDSTIDVENDILDSINRGLKDFEEGRTHSNESIRKLYEKYLRPTC